MLHEIRIGHRANDVVHARRDDVVLELLHTLVGRSGYRELVAKLGSRALEGLGDVSCAECLRDGLERFVVDAVALYLAPVSYTHLRAHETDSYLVCRLLL